MLNKSKKRGTLSPWKILGHFPPPPSAIAAKRYYPSHPPTNRNRPTDLLYTLAFISNFSLKGRRRKSRPVFLSLFLSTFSPPLPLPPPPWDVLCSTSFLLHILFLPASRMGERESVFVVYPHFGLPEKKKEIPLSHKDGVL